MANKHRYLYYDWKIKGRDARFAVDPELYSAAPDTLCDTLVFIRLENKEGSALTGLERRRAEGFEAKCRKKPGTVFAGFIEISAMRQYYVYIEESEYPRLCALMKKEKRFNISMGKKHEPSWATYFKLLYPNAVKFQTVLNAEQIQALYANGDSEAPRRLNLHMYFKTELLMLEYAALAKREGFAIGDYEVRYENERPHGIVLHRVCALKKRDVDELTVHAMRLAERYDGELLFWDCPIVIKGLK